MDHSAKDGLLSIMIRSHSRTDTLTMAMWDNLTVWLLTAVTLVAVTLLFNTLYNLYLHPLRNLPGPRLWASSHIPYTYHWMNGRMGYVLRDLHEEFGDVIRVAPNRVSFTHPDAWRDVRGHRKPGQLENGKDPIFYAMSQHNILGADREDHARFRRILSHGFSAKAMQDQQPFIAAYIDLLIRRLKEMTQNKKSPAVANLGAWFNFTTFDVIGDLAFGSPFGCLEKSDYHPWVTAILGGVKEFGTIQAIKWHSPFLLNTIKALFPQNYVGKNTDQQSAYAHNKIVKRLESSTSRPDFLHAMVTAKSEDGRALTTEELVTNARILILAGSETTATALTATAYYLATHPRVHAELSREVRTAFSSEEQIDFFSVNKLKYMLAVLDESMRMFPPVPASLPRVTARGGDVVCGYPIAEGAKLDIFMWPMNHSSRNFSEPDKFIPERWLDVDEFDGVRFDKSRHHAVQAFSVGPRNCIGKNLAYVEMRLILARLIWNFDLSLADKTSENWDNCIGFGLWVKPELNIRLSPVNKAAV
ncbi:cytochrome P450 monooxygenase [Podospora australis]|uniref:Cytochrome P450 monooxygenase n=1 Tax=Podospora australis TaxID=1536484 RepID=A0AAN6WX09_9PEZI|nr:cytochrome P450 monooxygenase [Podospora australis]